MPADAPPLAAQLAEARRELRVRQRAYPLWTTTGHLDPHTAAARLALQRAIVRTLARCLAAETGQGELFGESATEDRPN